MARWQRDEYTDKLTGELVGVEVIPLDDLHEHQSSPDCECIPRVENVGSTMKLIHYAFDGREWGESNFKERGC